jgi:hypothetical protein
MSIYYLLYHIFCGQEDILPTGLSVYKDHTREMVGGGWRASKIQNKKTSL